MNTHKNIAIAVALVVVLFAFGGNFYKPADSSSGLARDLSDLLPSFAFPSIHIPTLESSQMGLQAWSVWERYLEAAKNHDIETVQSLSHQTSATCQDPAREAECFTLMDSVYYFGSIFKKEAFTRIFSDDKQIIMMTEFITDPKTGPQSTQVVLFFTRTPDGTPKVLTMRFCFKDQLETFGGNCVETDPQKRDLDNNGWWDSVEALFYK